MPVATDIFEVIANALRHNLRQLGVGGYNVYIYDGPTDPLHRMTNYLSVCMGRDGNGTTQPKAVLSVDGRTHKWELCLQMARSYHYNSGHKPTHQEKPDKDFPVDWHTADVDYLVEVMMWHVAGVEQYVQPRRLA